MAKPIADRYLWLGAGIFFALAAYGIRYAIRDVVNLTKIDPIDSSSSNEDDDEPENSISLQTLKTLATSPNPNIANSAISLIIQRFASEPNASSWLAEDVRSEDPVLSLQAKTAVNFLRDWPFAAGLSMGRTPLHLPRVRRAHVRPLTVGEGEGRGDGDGRWSESVVDEDGLEWIDLYDDHVEPLVDADGAPLPSRAGAPNLETPAMGWTDIPRERPGACDDDDLELERRRGRREAMVLHEGGGRVEEGDIIRPR